MSENLQKFRIISTINNKETFASPTSRLAILPVFKFGTFEMEDKRLFKMDVIDFQTLTENFRAKKTPTPVLYEHGDGPQGGKAGGSVVALQDKSEDLFVHANLTKNAYNEVKDGEWLSCSAGFLANIDDEGYIRPKKLLEVSLTNMPAFGGLPEIQTFHITEVIAEKETTMETIKEEAPVAVVETTATEELSAEVKAELEAKQPEIDRVKAEFEAREVAVEPNQTNETLLDVIKGLTDRLEGLEARLAKEEPVPEPTVEDPPVEKLEDKEEEKVILSDKQMGDVIELVAETKFQDKVKKDKIEALMKQGEKDGKIVPANEKALRTLCEANPDSFEMTLPYLKQTAPTSPLFDPTLVNLEVGLLENSPEKEAAVLTQAMKLRNQFPNASLQEIVTLLKKSS